MRRPAALTTVATAILAALALWQGAVWLSGLPRFILPSPARVAETFWSSRALIGEHALITLAEVLLGLGLGAGLGAATAVALGLSPRLAAAARPLLVFSQAVPVFALAPILVLWFGFGMAPKIVMVVLIVYFPVTSAFHDGLMRAPAGFLDLGRVMGAGRWAEMRRIRIPAALPALGSGLRLAAVYAPIGAVIGEWVGASRGLGYLMLLANGRGKTDLMFAALIALATMAVALHRAVDALATWLDRRAA